MPKRVQRAHIIDGSVSSIVCVSPLSPVVCVNAVVGIEYVVVGAGVVDGAGVDNEPVSLGTAEDMRRGSIIGG